jgi:DnaJ-like protein/Sel1 repeat-containing protein
MENYYSILEISESATPEEIAQAYRLLLQVWHPDRFHHNPALLTKAEQKSREINVAFDTLSNPELKQRYDDGLRAQAARQGRPKPKPPEARITRCPDSGCNSVLRVDARTVVIVTCPTCRTTFRYDPERDEKWDIHPPEKDEFFTPARMAMLAIAVLFAVILIFTATKKSKVIISNKPAHTDEHATISGNAPFAFEAEEHDHDHSAAEPRDDVPHTPAPKNGQATVPRNAPTANTQREHMNGLDVMQRQMVQAARHAPGPSTDMISEVDLQQLKRLAAQGGALAQTKLGQLYESGRRGVPQDYEKARKYYEVAAAQGHAWAQTQLGQLYVDGRGVPQDFKKARQWWEQAATQGVSQAQYNLGQLYANGKGVPQDYKTARSWHEKAAAQGNAWAQAQLGQLYANGWGGPQDYVAAREWYEKAAAQGNAWAQAQLALL